MCKGLCSAGAQGQEQVARGSQLRAQGGARGLGQGGQHRGPLSHVSRAAFPRRATGERGQH